MQIFEALDLAERRLRRAGVDSPDWDAEILLRHVLNADRAGLIANERELLSSDVESRYFELVAARAERRPLQHLTGTQFFWRHEFVVTPDALIPRPETELAVQAALDLLHDVDAPCIVDVGTGTGCIALSLACERLDATIHAIDISPAALAVALTNASRLDCKDRVRLHTGDLLAPLAGSNAEFDLVVSNPPYVDSSEIDELQPEVRNHDPRLALLPPHDRYSIYRRLVPEARTVLKRNGWLVLEIGHAMEDDVRDICSTAGLTTERILLDLQKKPRIVLARKA
ncbi:MAG: peptide chain release factor N(5)-glutamine methyltransferase [Vicinamibacteria bacterium]|nr:peptide chain release factor N(5)-glutamine methyltransferase [Vicinamibacteria bacterium]